MTTILKVPDQVSWHTLALARSIVLQYTRHCRKADKTEYLVTVPTDSDLPPLPLLYSGFGEFHDFISNSADYPDAFSKEAEVDELVDTMGYLGYEKDKRAKTRDLSASAYLQVLRGGSTIASTTERKASTDGHVTASHGGPLRY
jgi:hypothetical protein